jgi:hypothetical protein
MYDEVLPKKLRDKILRELKGKPAKSVKHGDHDQSEHGNWATGGGNAFGYTAGKLPLSDNNQSPAANEVLMRARELQAEGRGEPIADPTEDNQYGGEYTYGRSEELLREVGFAVPGADTFIKGWTASVEDSTRYREEAEILARGGDASGVSRDTLAGLHLVEASAPTEETMYRGLSMSSEDLARYQVGSEVPLSFAAFTTARGESEQFASATQDKQAVQLVLESGAKAIPMVGFDPNSIIGEHVTSGWFEVVNVGTTRVTNGFGPTNEITQVTIRHTGTFDLGSPVKSLKHGDHDQSDHGAWAHGGNPLSTHLTDKATARFELLAEKGFDAAAKEWSLDEKAAEEIGLDRMQVAAVMAYGANGAEDVNRTLRLSPEDKDDMQFWKEYDPAMQAVISARMDEAIAKSSLPEQTILHRGMSFGTEEEASFIKAGSVYTDPGYGSTSKDMITASNFAMDPDGEKTVGVLWKITAPAGYPSLPMSEILESGEQEVILARDAHYRIDKVSTTGPEENQGMTVILVRATLLPVGTTKSVKHGDHDQDDHGSWATGGGGRRVSETQRKEAIERGSATTLGLSGDRNAVQRALRAYTAAKLSDDDDDRPVHAVLNQHLRDGRPLSEALDSLDPEDKAAFEELDRQFQPSDKGWKEVPSVLVQDTMLYRGMPGMMDPDQVMDLEAGRPVDFGFGILEPGDRISDRGYGSTSLEARHATYFAERPVLTQDEWTDDSPEQVPVIWKISAPEGTPALSVDHSIGEGQVYGEAEIILGRNTTYEITNVSYSNRGVIVEAKIVQ